MEAWKWEENKIVQLRAFLNYWYYIKLCYPAIWWSRWNWAVTKVRLHPDIQDQGRSRGEFLLHCVGTNRVRFYLDMTHKVWQHQRSCVGNGLGLRWVWYTTDFPQQKLLSHQGLKPDCQHVNPNLATGRPWASYLIPLGLSLHIWRMKLIIALNFESKFENHINS